MIVNGKEIAADILRQVREQVAARGLKPVMRVLVMTPNAATESYLRIKTEKAREAGMYLELVRIENDATTEQVLEKVALPGADALLVQLPLPSHIDTKMVLDAIPVALDADVLSTAAYERFLNADPGAPLPPVVGAIAEILARSRVTIAGERAVVVGSGRLVGQPARAWLMAQHAEVLVLTKENFEERKAALKSARLVIAGAGSPHLITPDLLAEGVVLIDAGTSESDGAIVGDFDPACAEKASVFTPVPGGLGPVAVACLFQNAARLLSAAPADA